jgi:hypothetical protein
MDPMDVLTTRALSYTDETGNTKELILTVFVPFEASEYKWKCGFVTDPPLRPNITYGLGLDFICAVVACLWLARLHFETVERSRRVHWRGMPDCGLPELTDEPAAPDPTDVPPPVEIGESKDIFATRTVGYRDESGIERERYLTVFVPSKEGEAWKCGFTFEPPPFASIRYGVGEDFIEALLDGLAKARAIFEETIPKGSVPSEEHFDCADLPYKIGRSFFLNSARESLLDTPDVSAD